MRSPDPDVDMEAVARFQHGDEDAFGELAARWEDELLRLAYRLTGDVDAAQDVRQMALLKIHQGLPGFDGRSRPFTWAYRVVLNLCRDRLRRTQARERAMERLERELGARGGSEAEGVLAAATLVRGETARRVALAVLELPAREREVVVLRHYHELPFAAIAEITGAPVTTVQSRLAKGLWTLSNRLKDLEP